MTENIITIDGGPGLRSQELTAICLKQAATGTKLASLHKSPTVFAKKVLAEFDRRNEGRLSSELIQLSAGSMGISDTNLPASFQRNVIKEALSDLRVLELVNANVDPSATITTGIPYEERDISGVINDGVVYEGNAISRAGLRQGTEYAYILALKLAFLISNELIHFSQKSAIDWDAYARSVESCARIIKELVAKKICNEIQRASDAYLAADISSEGIDAQLDGSTHTIKTVQFPIVRPFQEVTIQGNLINAEENPIVVRLDGAVIDPYNGSGSQAPGTYYRVTSYNLGYIQFVDEAGSPVAPPNSAGADDISYSYATNVAKFDIDNGSTDFDKHLNGLLRTIGARKALMSADRFIAPDFMLMSPVLNDLVTNAEQFSVSNHKNGTDLDNLGDLQQIKAVPAWSTNSAALTDMGDERIIIGQRGVAGYVIAKPFEIGSPFEVHDSNGYPTGQKQAYGEEFSVIKVPVPMRNRFTSVLAYSAAGR